MTSPVPKASERGTLRRGSFTSPAVKVMLFQASAEKSEPTWATQMAINIPITPLVADTIPTDARSDWIGVTTPGVHKLEKLALMAAALRLTKMPSAINASSDNVFAEVKTF